MADDPNHQEDAEEKDLAFEDFKTTFTMINKILKVNGIHLTEEKISGRAWWRDSWLYVLNVFLILLATLLEILSILDIVISKGDFGEVVSAMPLLCYCILALTKTIPLHYKRAEAARAIRVIHEAWPRKLTDVRVAQAVQADLKQVHLATKAYFWTEAVVLAIFLILPYLRVVYSKVSGVHLDLILPFDYWFPFDPYQGIMYHCVMILMWHNGIIVVAYQLCGDLMFTVISSHLCTLYKLLAEDIERAKDYETLSSLIQKQNVLIGLSQNLESLFTFGMLVNCIISSILICCCGFYAVIIESLITIHYKLFLGQSLTQFGIMCWYGQKLLDVSDHVLNAAYSSEWYDTCGRFRTAILFLMQRSQKPMMVTACNFAIIGLASYTAILKASWSYFMFLMTVYEV